MTHKILGSVLLLSTSLPLPSHGLSLLQAHWTPCSFLNRPSTLKLIDSSRCFFSCKGPSLNVCTLPYLCSNSTLSLNPILTNLFLLCSRIPSDIPFLIPTTDSSTRNIIHTSTGWKQQLETRLGIFKSLYLGLVFNLSSYTAARDTFSKSMAIRD